VDGKVKVAAGLSENLPINQKDRSASGQRGRSRWGGEKKLTGEIFTWFLGVTPVYTPKKRCSRRQQGEPDNGTGSGTFDLLNGKDSQVI